MQLGANTQGTVLGKGDGLNEEKTSGRTVPLERHCYANFPVARPHPQHFEIHQKQQYWQHLLLTPWEGILLSYLPR